jgi:hypothetical protein
LLELAFRFGAALGLGLLLGLERERKRDLELMFGGGRTLALARGYRGSRRERLVHRELAAEGRRPIVSCCLTAVKGLP